MSVLNNGYGDLESLSLPQLRIRAAAHGIDSGGKKREEIVRAFYRREQELAQLRRQCAERGLDCDGTREELQLRLAAAESGAVSQPQRNLYRLCGFAVIALGTAGLAVSLPHVAAALETVTGVKTANAYLLALILDGGICAFKVIEALSEKFETRPVQPVVSAGLIVALALSAVLNATEFAQNAKGPGGLVLAVAVSVFLSAFVYGNFCVGAYFMLHCDPREDRGRPDPVRRLREAADTIERLTGKAEAI